MNQASRTVFVGKKPITPASAIPAELLNDPILNKNIEDSLPSNYNFEIHKTIWRIRRDTARRVCLQFPDGLFIFSISIVNILETFCPGVDFIVMGDVVYGACCIDDVKAKELGCDMLVHYGHSCLIPITVTNLTGVTVLYVFVDIKFDLLHFIQMVVKNFNPNEHRLCLASTIQFLSSTHLAANELRNKYFFQVFLPQSRPLTSGEILGCTAPSLRPEQANTIVFIADGRFHLEALMIANPTLPAYRYNPYNKEMTHEHYAHEEMIEQRSQAVHRAQQVLQENRGAVGIILGTLGRQGNARIVDVLKKSIQKVSRCSILLFFIAEITPQMLKTLGSGQVKFWVQIGCPRLSIDWGSNFVEEPLLTPYELRTAVKTMEKTSKNFEAFTQTNRYPMDFYAASSLGSWTPNHKCHESCQCDQ